VRRALANPKTLLLGLRTPISPQKVASRRYHKTLHQEDHTQVWIEAKVLQVAVCCASAGEEGQVDPEEDKDDPEEDQADPEEVSKA
jgi:hypothetical protein